MTPGHRAYLNYLCSSNVLISLLMVAEVWWNQSQDDTLCKELNQVLLALRTEENYEPNLRTSKIKGCDWNNLNKNINYCCARKHS